MDFYYATSSVFYALTFTILYSSPVRRNVLISLIRQTRRDDLSLLVELGQLAADRDVDRLASLGEAADVDALLEGEGVLR